MNDQSSSLLDRIDHLILATPDLEQTVEDLAQRLGVQAVAGGQHPGRGTRNALLSLSPSTYLEILGLDPLQPAPDGPRWFGLDALSAPRLVTWAAKGKDLAGLSAAAAQAGVQLGPVSSGERRTPDGTLLRWQLTDPDPLVEDGLLPFFIDWGSSPHPARSAPAGLTLVGLRGEHPQPEQVRRALSVVDLDLAVVQGHRPALIAALDTPHGRFELR